MRTKILCLGLLGAVATALSGIPLGAQDSWRGLQVAPENRCTDYDSDDYRYSQAVEDDIIRDHGGIYSPYTAEWFETKRQTDIEHIVARSEAHDSGLCSASPATRRQFAEDLLNLTLASPSVNRHQKVDKDAAEWLPDRNKCWFADRIVKVRQKYGLTIDRREVEALEGVFSSCSSVEMVVYSSSESGASTTASGQASREPEGPCGPFANCTELRRQHPNGVPEGHCAYQSGMDRDRDGWACETGGSGGVASTPSPRPTPQGQVTRSGCGPFRNCTALRRVHPRGVPRGHCAYSSRMDRDKDGWACER